MSPFVVIGGASVAAIVVGLVIAGVVEHVAWRLAEEGRRRRSRRCHGDVRRSVR